MSSSTLLFAFPRIALDESNLVITNVNKGDDGNYTCIIKSELEEKSASARLMVMGMTQNENQSHFINHAA